MKSFILCVVVILPFVDLSLAATCTANGDLSTECSGMICDNDWTPACHNNVCTCDHADHNVACTTADTCGGGSVRCTIHWHGHDFNRGKWHCVDNKCRCSVF